MMHSRGCYYQESKTDNRIVVQWLFKSGNTASTKNTTIAELVGSVGIVLRVNAFAVRLYGFNCGYRLAGYLQPITPFQKTV